MRFACSTLQPSSTRLTRAVDGPSYPVASIATISPARAGSDPSPMHWAAPISGIEQRPGRRRGQRPDDRSLELDHLVVGHRLPGRPAGAPCAGSGDDRAPARRTSRGARRTHPARAARRSRTRGPLGHARPSRRPAARFAIDLAQDVVGQADAVDLPATLAGHRLGGVVERLVARLEQPVVDRVQVGVRGHVHAEQDAVRVAQEEVARGVRLAAELPETRGDVDVEVRVRVEQPTDERQVLGGAADVGADERRRGMARRRAARTPPAARRTAGSRARRASSGGRVGQKCQSGLSCSSSQRSLVGSSGSKNATGSAMWMRTGTPRSAAAPRADRAARRRPPRVGRQRRAPAGRAASRP